MKQLLKKPFVLASLLLIIYLFSLVLSACTISAYPLSRQKNFLTKRAQEIVREHLDSTDEIYQLWLDGSMRVLIYDAEGNRLRDIASNSGFEPHVAHEKYLPRVLAGEEIFKLMLAQEPFPVLHGLMGVVGTPVIEEGRVVGAVFLIRKTIAVVESLVGYTIFFTLIYWLSAFFIVSTFQKRCKLDKLQQNYIANVAHALKTPVASIKALAETLCDGVEPDQVRQTVYCGMILQEANRQDHMIRNVLELARLQSIGLDFTKSKLPAATVFDPVLGKYFTLCDCMGITLHIPEDISHLPSMYTNEACAKHILEILLDNALKFVPEGGDIWLDTSVSRNQLVVCVRDNGIGISQEALPHVFERFFKVGYDFNSSGSGLGLAIAKELAAGLKEKIWVESTLGHGAAFFFTVRTK